MGEERVGPFVYVTLPLPQYPLLKLGNGKYSLHLISVWIKETTVIVKRTPNRGLATTGTKTLITETLSTTVPIQVVWWVVVDQLIPPDSQYPFLPVHKFLFLYLEVPTGTTPPVPRIVVPTDRRKGFIVPSRVADVITR